MIKFYKKSFFDLFYTLPTATVTDAVATNTGQDFINFMRNRDNNSGWATTGSTDAANTTIVFNFNDLREFNRIMILGHNLKSFTLKYWDEVNLVWANFSTTINPTSNTATSNYYEFDLVESSQIQLIILGAQTVNQDKMIRQFLVCEEIGRFVMEPEVEVTLSRDRKATKYISSKSFVATQVGSFACSMKRKSVSLEADLALVETLYRSFDGFLVSLSGGETTQFETIRNGYRLEDIYFVQCSNEYEPSWVDGHYKHGIDVDIKMVEVN